MGLFSKVLVYQSKDIEDYEKAKELLEKENIEFKAWEAEELPVGGCGCKIDIRKTTPDKIIPKIIYRIEVEKKIEEKAKSVLLDKVKALKSYGV